MRRSLIPVAAILCLLLAAVSDAGRILAVFPFPAPSHLMVLNTLINELAERGHQATVITPILQMNPPKLLRQIHVDIKKEDLLAQVNINPSTIFNADMSIKDKVSMLFGFGSICEMILSQPHIREFIKSTTDQYDVLIIPAFFNECLLGFSHRFNIPIIQVCPFRGMEWTTDVTGNPHSYAYIGDMNLKFGTHMTFKERLINTVVGFVSKSARNFIYLPMQHRIMEKHFRGTGKGPLPYIGDIEKTTALLLLNNHVSLSYARPYMPNVIEVGGLHIKTPKKLPEDLLSFLDSALDGVIYFSMGSNLRSADMPADKRDAILQGFASLKQKVLWKWEDDVLPGQPGNVKLGKWLPQSDLLAHHNVKVFITHGGLLSTEEAVYHGKPVIGIPILGDQHMNMNQAVISGYGYLLPFNNITSQSLALAVNTVLTTPRYMDRAREISAIFRDQPHSPLETAVFWSEYVIRHKGTRHMRSAVLDLTWYQYNLLDVIAVIAVSMLLAVTLLFIVLRTAVRCCRTDKKKPIKEKKKRN